MVALSKPVIRKARVRPEAKQHGVSEELVITIYPGGDIGIREARRRSMPEQRFSAMALYVGAVTREIMMKETRR